MYMRNAVRASEDDIIQFKKKCIRIEEKYIDNPIKQTNKPKKVNKEIDQQEKCNATLKTTMMQ